MSNISDWNRHSPFILIASFFLESKKVSHADVEVWISYDCFILLSELSL